MSVSNTSLNVPDIKNYDAITIVYGYANMAISSAITVPVSRIKVTSSGAPCILNNAGTAKAWYISDTSLGGISENTSYTIAFYGVKV